MGRAARAFLERGGTTMRKCVLLVLGLALLVPARAQAQTNTD
jgi:hypothetical protein